MNSQNSPPEIEDKVGIAGLALYPKLFNVKNKKVKQLLDNLTTRISAFRRIYQNVQDLKYLCQIPERGLITTVFKITRFEDKKEGSGDVDDVNIEFLDSDEYIGANDSTSCIYGYLYSEYKDDKIEHKYICTGGTYTSQDGEYRKRFTPFYKLENAKKDFPKQWEFVEELIVSKMNDGDIQLNADFFFPSTIDEESRRIFIENVNCSRCAIYLYMLCWMVDFNLIHLKMIENHINPAYQYILYDKSDIPAYEDWIKLFETYDEVIKLKSYVERMVMGIPMSTTERYENPKLPNNTVYLLITGQKLFSLTAHELENHLDIDSNIWREYYLSSKTSDLLINVISPSFAIINKWFIIEGGHPGIFDNPSQYTRFIQGKTADEIANELTQIDKLAYESSIELNTQRPKSVKFQDLSTLIHDGINYARTNITLTDKILCLHVEHVGSTIRDIPAFSKHANIEYKQINKTFTNYELFKGYLFEYLYGLYCMNTVIGAMHGDLHVNNVTIFQSMVYIDTKILQTKYKLYVFEEPSPEVYAFEHVGVFGVIIDFSRSILGNLNILKRDFGKKYADDFMEKQTIRILKLVELHFPELYSKNEKIFKVRVESDPEMVFKVISIIDVITLTKGMLSMFILEQNSDFSQTFGKFQLQPEIESIVKVASNRATELFIEYFEILVADITNKKIVLMEWPILVLIREIFKSNMHDLSKPTNDNKPLPQHIYDNISDMFVYQKEMKYSLANYEKYPEIMKPDFMLDIYIKNNVQSKIDEYTQILEYLQGKEKNEK